MNIWISELMKWRLECTKHTLTKTCTHSQWDTHILWLWSYPKGMFCAEVTVQLGRACLRAARLETEGDTLPRGSVRVSVCECVCVCGAESTTGASVMGVNGEGVWTSDQFQMSFVILFILLRGGSVKMMIHGGELFKELMETIQEALSLESKY